MLCCLCVWVGTPHWSAPEVLKKQVYSESADVYSFGYRLPASLRCLSVCKLGLISSCVYHRIVMWELLTRGEPYNGEQPVLVASKVVDQDARPEVRLCALCVFVFVSLLVGKSSGDDGAV